MSQFIENTESTEITEITDMKQANTDIRFDVPHIDAEDHDKKVMAEASTLVSMLYYGRPSGEMNEGAYADFIKRFITPYFGKPDKFGNFIRIIKDTDGKMPSVMWTSHHDTVHYVNENYADKDIVFYTITDPKFKPSAINGNLSHDTQTKIARGVNLFLKKPTGIPEYIPGLKKTVDTFFNEAGEELYQETREVKMQVRNPAFPKMPRCLGADCTTGIFIMQHMIENNVPGVYVVFADEEIGRKGSEAMVKAYRDSINLDGKKRAYRFIDYIDHCVSFDRFGYNDIIVKQSGQRTASDRFGNWFGKHIGEFVAPYGYPIPKASDRGSFTDSYSFREIIPECTNICVGYKSQHSFNETQDLKYAMLIANAMIDIGRKFSSDSEDYPPICRDPKEFESNSNFTYGYSNSGYEYASYYKPKFTRVPPSRSDSFDYDYRNGPHGQGYYLKDKPKTVHKSYIDRAEEMLYGKRADQADQADLYDDMFGPSYWKDEKKEDVTESRSTAVVAVDTDDIEESLDEMSFSEIVETIMRDEDPSFCESDAVMEWLVNYFSNTFATEFVNVMFKYFTTKELLTEMLDEILPQSARNS